MLITQVFAAWLIIYGQPPIPFNSYEECLEAKIEIQLNERYSPSAVCIHGKKGTK